MTHTLWIPGPLPGENDIIDAAKGCGGRGYHYSTMKKTWTQTVALLAKRIPHMDRVYLRLTWNEKHRQRNPDNIAAGIKFLLDGLVVAKVLDNDGWQQIAGWDNVFQVGPEPGLHVTLEDRSSDDSSTSTSHLAAAPSFHASHTSG